MFNSYIQLQQIELRGGNSLGNEHLTGLSWKSVDFNRNVASPPGAAVPLDVAAAIVIAATTNWGSGTTKRSHAVDDDTLPLYLLN